MPASESSHGPRHGWAGNARSRPATGRRGRDRSRRTRAATGPSSRKSAAMRLQAKARGGDGLAVGAQRLLGVAPQVAEVDRQPREQQRGGVRGRNRPVVPLAMAEHERLAVSRARVEPACPAPRSPAGCAPPARAPRAAAPRPRLVEVHERLAEVRVVQERVDPRASRPASSAEPAAFAPQGREHEVGRAPAGRKVRGLVQHARASANAEIISPFQAVSTLRRRHAPPGARRSRARAGDAGLERAGEAEALRDPPGPCATC